MRAARRIIVLAGILALAVCAPITWTQAGAQSEGEQPQITFVKIMCADFGVIPQNYVTPDNLPARPKAPSSARASARRQSSEEAVPDGCEQVDGWDFVLGSDANLVQNGAGRMVDPSLEHLTGTVALTADQAALLDGRNLRASEVEQPGFGFGTIRCGTDNTNGDNLEFLGTGDPLLCIAYNVGAPVTITKTVSGTFDGESQFSFELTCGDGESTTYDNTFDLGADGSTNLWLPYGTDCHLTETRHGRRRRRHLRRQRGERIGQRRKRERPDARLHDSGHRREQGRPDHDRGHECARARRPRADEGREPEVGGSGQPSVVRSHRDEPRSRLGERRRTHRHAAHRRDVDDRQRSRRRERRRIALLARDRRGQQRADTSL